MVLLPEFDFAVAAPPMRQRVVDEIANLLEPVAPGHVHVWRVTPFSEAELPAIEIRDVVLTERDRLSAIRWRYALAVDLAVTASGGSAHSAVRALMDSALAALFASPTLLALVEGLSLSEDEPGAMAVEHEGRRIAAETRRVLVTWIGVRDE